GVTNDDVTPGNSGCQGKGSGLQAIWNNGKLGGVQLLDAVHGDGRRSCARYSGAAGVQEVCEIHDLRFRRTILDDSSARSPAGGDHQVLSGSRAGELQNDVRASKAAHFAGVDAMLQL